MQSVFHPYSSLFIRVHLWFQETMSWFIVSLQYVAPLSAIDAAMRSHVAFLERQRKAGVFIAWGRKVPRTGGIILASADSRAEIERIMAADPFVARRLAEVEVTEFQPKPPAIVDAVQRLLDPRRWEERD
jgi:uncharacterized protein YciI